VCFTRRFCRRDSRVVAAIWCAGGRCIERTVCLQPALRHSLDLRRFFTRSSGFTVVARFCRCRVSLTIQSSYSAVNVLRCVRLVAANVAIDRIYAHSSCAQLIPTVCYCSESLDHNSTCYAFCLHLSRLVVISSENYVTDSSGNTIALQWRLQELSHEGITGLECPLLDIKGPSMTFWYNARVED